MISRHITSLTMSELRAFVKAAREAIEKKDYREGRCDLIIFISITIILNEAALKQCKNALRLDKKNYNVWLLAGKSSFECSSLDNDKEEREEEKMTPLEQSDAAYRKAIEIDEANPLAWRVCVFRFIHLIRGSRDVISQCEIMI